MYDFSVLNRDDREEPVVIGGSRDHLALLNNEPSVSTIQGLLERPPQYESSGAYRSDTQLAPDDRRHLSAEDFYGAQHCFVWQRRDTHLECDTGDATENFIHVKDLFRDRVSVAD